MIQKFYKLQTSTDLLKCEISRKTNARKKAGIEAVTLGEPFPKPPIDDFRGEFVLGVKSLFGDENFVCRKFS